jgi:glycosyltransferase involved in cell wall biosynthesis
MRVVVDARKAFDAGIGTYIQAVVPRVAQLSELPFAALISTGQAKRYSWLSSAGVQLMEMDTPPMGLAEQVEFRHLIGTGGYFWATSLAHPMVSSVPVVATVHDVAQLALPRREMGGGPLLRPAVGAYLHSLRRRARALFAVSSFTQTEFLRFVGKPRVGEFTITPLGVEDSWAGGSHGRPSIPYLLCLGSVRPHKNVERLMQAFAHVAPRLSHQLRIVGRLPKDGIHLRWRAALPEAVRSRVVFQGELDDPALRACMTSADALLFPSLYEGFGLPVLEAMAAGCPVAAARAGALPEVYGTAAAATFDPRDVLDMARAIDQVVGMDTEARQAIVEKGRAHAASFRWEETAKRTASVLRGLLGRGTRR